MWYLKFYLNLFALSPLSLLPLGLHRFVDGPHRKALLCANKSINVNLVSCRSLYLVDIRNNCRGTNIYRLDEDCEAWCKIFGFY